MTDQNIREGRPMTFDPILRYQNLLIAMCREVRNREIYAAELLLAPGFFQNKSRAHEINKSANRLRFMLNKNHRAMRYFFGTCDPEEIKNVEVRKDEVAPAVLGRMQKSRDNLESALWSPSVVAQQIHDSVVIAIRRLRKEGYNVTCFVPGSDEEVDLDPDTMALHPPVKEDGTATEIAPDERDEQPEAAA